tara:strand:- start:159 stop:686 length:528 start_codon:yes stop_codon:yes gene_type:complete
MKTTQNKTITLNISNDYDSSNAWYSYIEQINYIANELDFHCEIRNNRLINIIAQEQRYSTDIDQYENKIIVETIGYSQGDWQTYELYYNDFESKEQKALFDDLIALLKRSFTHFNNYYFELIESVIVESKEYENKEPIENGVFIIDWIEFPDNDDILAAFNESYGLNYDKHVIKD